MTPEVSYWRVTRTAFYLKGLSQRGIPSRQSVDLYSATTSTEEEQFLMMEVPNGSKKIA